MLRNRELWTEKERLEDIIINNAIMERISHFGILKKLQVHYAERGIHFYILLWEKYYYVFERLNALDTN
jgi:hypothetical protein